MPLLPRVILSAALAVCASTASADEIESGLWKVTTWIEQGGIIAPPQTSMKCLTPRETGDLATTFSPVSRTINSDCAPLERNLNGKQLSWKLTCKGQLNMEVTAAFVFDTPHHYTATIRNNATMGGMQMVDTRTMIEAERVSKCD